MYSFVGRVRYSEIDERGRLSIPATINYLQDCSTFHSESVGLGPAHVEESGIAWLLAAWEIEIRELPRFNDEIRITTWPTSFKGLRANRNFTICEAADTRGERPLVRADSSWFTFDARAARPIRTPESEYAAYLPDTQRDRALDLPKIPRSLHAEAPGVAAAAVTVTGAHIDTNHHVNNAQYVSLALGALEAGAAEGVRWLDVHYSKAARLGDTIYPHIHNEADGSLIVTLDNAEGAPYALVRLRS